MSKILKAVWLITLLFLPFASAQTQSDAQEWLDNAGEWISDTQLLVLRLNLLYERSNYEPLSFESIGQEHQARVDDLLNRYDDLSVQFMDTVNYFLNVEGEEGEVMLNLTKANNLQMDSGLQLLQILKHSSLSYDTNLSIADTFVLKGSIVDIWKFLRSNY